MAKSGDGNGENGNTGNNENGNTGNNGGLNPGFNVSYDSESGTFTPSGPTTPSWGPGNTPGAGDTNPAGLNNSENNKDSKNNINLNEAAAKNEAAKKNAEKSNDKNKAPNIPDYVITEQSEAIGRGKNHMNPAFEYAVIHCDNNAPAVNNAPATNNAPADTSAPATTPAANNAPGGNLGGETGGIVSGAAPTNTSDATNTGITYRGGTVTTPSGTSVTDSGTGGSISSSVTPPIRDESSIGLGVYNNDRANYDQDNWNRGMESESSSLVSDEECKAFAKRAFMENSEPFKKVRITIIKNVR